MNQIRKPQYGFWIFLGIIALYVGYLVSGIFIEGKPTLETISGSLEHVFRNPIKNYWNAMTPKSMIFAALIWSVAFLHYLSSQRNYMPGREYGTAKFANIKALVKKYADKDDSKNRILTQNFRMSIDTRKTRCNNNLMGIGGAGAGKSTGLVMPNMFQCSTSMIFTDPKGELLLKIGKYLLEHGYVIKVLNLVNMEESDCYNPFRYVRDETDVVKLITNLIANTTPKGAVKGDPFWEKAESLYLQALFLYVWKEEPSERRNFNTLLEYLNLANVDEENDSELDLMFMALPDGHVAKKAYHKFRSGAGDTLRSIIISANARMAFFENEKLKRILSDDEIDIPFLGIGKNGDKKTKTALFCVIPDSDKSYNFVVGMLYTQIFQELYYIADHKYGGRLPIPVHLWMDEFANVALPEDFCSLLSTMRSREISCSIIIQNMAQIKALFKDTWETITGNCDTLLYLGGNEQSTFKYISELMGKWTIDKRSSGESFGRNGSSSRNYDILGRELMTQDEIRKMPKDKCLLFLKGEDVIYDDKYAIFQTPDFLHSEELGEYHHIIKTPASKHIEILDKESIEHYKKESEAGENIKTYTLDLEAFLQFNFESVDQDMDIEDIQALMKTDEVQEKINAMESTVEEIPSDIPEIGNWMELSVMDLLANDLLTPVQKKNLMEGLQEGIDEETIKNIIRPEFTEEQMAELRKAAVLIKQNRKE